METHKLLTLVDRERIETQKGQDICISGRIFIITGGSRGLGYDLAASFAQMGAKICVAGRNGQAAEDAAKRLSGETGAEVIGLAADVTDEESVYTMVYETVRRFGGLDVMISCAGILKAGALPDMSLEDFDSVTATNYTGYFLCAKYASAVMKEQRAIDEYRMHDIIEINSKSGLEGSSSNSAYAGSKFGGIGLTQSFALELAPFGIKVNAICPGNLLDGSLWNDPDHGLFKQYLDAGRVPGATTIAEARAHYEAKVPLGRGCQTIDVVRAVKYVIEQQYETGQAIPVTGGQVMIK